MTFHMPFKASSPHQICADSYYFNSIYGGICDGVRAIHRGGVDHFHRAVGTVSVPPA